MGSSSLRRNGRKRGCAEGLAARRRLTGGESVIRSAQSHSPAFPAVLFCARWIVSIREAGEGTKRRDGVPCPRRPVEQEKNTVARIAGVNIPTNKRVEIALTYIHGIGPAKAKEITAKLGFARERRVQDLSDQEVLQIREAIDAGYTVEGDLRRQTAMNIKRLMDLACYRGLRHRKGLPVRGQRTHTNARTRKGPAKPIAGKKKVTK